MGEPFVIYRQDIALDARRFYTLFYHQAPTDQQVDALLSGSPGR
jgi:hypothetical protein